MSMDAIQAYTAVIEQDTATGYYVAYVPDLPGAHTQAETLEELRHNLKEVVGLTLENYDPTQKPESHFVGTQLVSL
jgi:predicted RNase H-like HicB family nuclease